MHTLTPYAFDRLASAVDGRLMVCGGAEGPEAVLFAASTDDVATTIDFARRNGLRVLARRAGQIDGDLRGTVVIRTSLLRDIHLDSAGRVVRVGAGATWGAVGSTLEPFGMLALGSSGPDCGLVGPVLRGGFGWLGRRHGMSGSTLVAAELVTGDGRVRRIDEDTDPELFWALRGGVDAVGVVTALEYEARRHEPVHAGELSFPLDRAPEVLRAWLEWTDGLDDGTTSRLSLGAAVRIELSAEDRAVVTALRALGPVIDTVAPSLVSPWPVKTRDRGATMMLDAVDVDTVLQARVPLELQHLGGALGRPDPRLSLQRLPGRFRLRTRGRADRDGEVRTLVDALASLERPIVRDADTLARLDRVRSAADPARVMVP
ncbi:MAG TPA: FAD-dependent oxidoreductase [Rhodoglobus sp.]|nr:FAD-dependent oxidoreductase [Rhodoglobus sp.]